MSILTGAPSKCFAGWLLAVLGLFSSAQASATFSIGGSLTGLLAGGTIVLQNNFGNNLALISDGAFLFSTPLNDGEAYSISIAMQPSGQACSVSNGSGTVSGSAITNVSVVCSNTPCLGVDQDDVFAVSFTTGELIRYRASDPANTKTTMFPGGSLVSPESMVLGPDCNLYIGESGDGSTFAPRISKVEIETVTLSTVYPFASFEIFPASLAFQNNDLLIGRSPFYSNNTGPIVKLSNATGGALAISDYTSGTSLASSPGIALDSSGRLYVSDQTFDSNTQIASGPIKRFDASGGFLAELIADGASGLAGPAGMMVVGGSLYTIGAERGDVLETDLATDTTTTFSKSALGKGRRYVLSALSDGGLLVGRDNGNIYRFDTNGAVVDTFASGLQEISGIATVAGSSVQSLYQIGGSVTGLATGETVVLQSNGGDDLTLAANGSFIFSAQVPDGDVYDVTVLTQPTGQTCSVTNGAGTVNGASVTNIAVSCLSISQYQIVSTSGDALTGTFEFTGDVSSDGVFNFASNGLPLSSPSLSVSRVATISYLVTSDGTMSGSFEMEAPLSDGTFDFSSNGSPMSSSSFTWAGGSANNLPNQNDDYEVSNGDVIRVKYDLSDLRLLLDGTYQAGGISPSSETGTYSIAPQNVQLTSEVFTDLPNQSDTYEIVNGQLTALKYDSTNNDGFELRLNDNLEFVVRDSALQVVASGTYELKSQHQIGGVVSGLASGATLILQINGADDLSISTNGGFVFNDLSSDGSGFAVTIQMQPVGQTCTLTDAAGTVNAADVSNIAVTCSTNSYSIGGLVSGLLDGQSLSLQNNAGDDLIVNANGSFSFATPVLHNGSYAVSVLTQSLGQTCIASNLTGTVNAASITNIAVTCSTNSYSIGGSVSGLLNGQSLSLQNNAGDDLIVSSNGSFAFASPILHAGSYAVSVLTQPSGQSCTLTDSTGTVNGANVTNIAVDCVQVYSVGGQVTGLLPNRTLVLQKNAGNDLMVSANGAFTFQTLLLENDNYSVSIKTQPAGQNCSVGSASGTIATQNINNISITCTVIPTVFKDRFAL